MVGFKPSYLGFLLGFSGGSYYQYKKLAPYVNQNWKLSTELWKVENILYVMNNVLVYEEKGEAEKLELVRDGVPVGEPELLVERMMRKLDSALRRRDENIR